MKKYPACIGTEKCFCSDFKLDDSVCDYAAGDEYKKCTHTVMVENEELRARIAELESRK